MKGYQPDLDSENSRVQVFNKRNKSLLELGEVSDKCPCEDGYCACMEEE